MLTSRLLILNQKEAECKEMAAYFQDSGYSVIWCTEYDEATEILSRGKNKPEFTPHVDTGDYVIVINAEKVKVTGKKMDQKVYHHHSDYVGGMKEVTLKEKMAKKPEQVIELAVKGMLPKGPLGRQMYTKLHVYAGSEHKHQAQKPEVLTF